MATDDKSRLPNDSETGTESGTEFFDRERWHDVESDSDSSQEDSETRHGSAFSPFSIAVLLLIAVIAGGAGIISAYLIPLVFSPTQPPRPKTDYRSTPTLWIGYAENSVFLCDLNEPSAFTASGNGTIYLGDANPASVKVYSPTGKLIRSFSLESEPKALAVKNPAQEGDESRLYVVSDHRLALYSAEGTLIDSWSLPEEDADIRCLAVSDGNVFAADTKNRVVYRFDETGKLLGTFGRKPETSRKTESDKSVSVPEALNTFGGFTVFLAPLTLAVSPKTGLLHVANPGLHRIEAFTSEGHWEPSLSWQNNSADITGFCGCCNPVAIDTFGDGRILTSEKDVTRVKVYRSGGRLDCVVAGPEVLGKKPLNIPQLLELPAVSGEDKKSLYVAALDNDDVIVFDPVWRIVRIFVPAKSP